VLERTHLSNIDRREYYRMLSLYHKFSRIKGDIIQCISVVSTVVISRYVEEDSVTDGEPQIAYTYPQNTVI
jgi:hypothetical protein